MGGHLPGRNLSLSRNLALVRRCLLEVVLLLRRCGNLGPAVVLVLAVVRPGRLSFLPLREQSFEHLVLFLELVPEVFHEFPELRVLVLQVLILVLQDLNFPRLS